MAVVAKKYRILKNLFFWLFAFSLLTFIYGTAYGSYKLGTRVILLLLPVHMCYFYLIGYWVLPRFFFKSKYVHAFLASLCIMFLMAVLYRIVEIFVADPCIYRFYKARDVNFSWPGLSLPWWKRLSSLPDFVNAIERSNVVVWICVSLQLFTLWHDRRQALLQAELNVLKGQLHPHFLFNSLNNLYALALDNSSRTPQIILELSNILRYSLYECAGEEVLLKRDLEVLCDYIDLEKIRYEERLELNVNISPNTGNLKIAPLLMLPLVENAFTHGAAETIGTPWINIELQIRENELLLKISNSKPEQTTTDSGNPAGRIGISNVRKRLELLYPGRYSFECFDEGDCFITGLHIHLHENKDN